MSVILVRENEQKQKLSNYFQRVFFPTNFMINSK